MNKPKKSYYETLGVSIEAGPKEIKRAYKSLIRQFSPEHHPEEFKSIREAYDMILKPPDKFISFPLYTFPHEWVAKRHSAEKAPDIDRYILKKVFETPFNTNLELRKYVETKLKIDNDK